jgi:hypothetical protein
LLSVVTHAGVADLYRYVAAMSQGFCCLIGRKTRKRPVAVEALEDQPLVIDTPQGRYHHHTHPQVRAFFRENAPVDNYANTGDAIYLHRWVAEVTVAHPNGSLIRKYQSQRARLEQVYWKVDFCRRRRCCCCCCCCCPAVAAAAVVVVVVAAVLDDDAAVAVKVAGSLSSTSH